MSIVPVQSSLQKNSSLSEVDEATRRGFQTIVSAVLNSENRLALETQRTQSCFASYRSTAQDKILALSEENRNLREDLLNAISRQHEIETLYQEKIKALDEKVDTSEKMIEATRQAAKVSELRASSAEEKLSDLEKDAEALVADLEKEIADISEAARENSRVAAQRLEEERQEWKEEMRRAFESLEGNRTIGDIAVGSLAISATTMGCFCEVARGAISLGPKPPRNIHGYRRKKEEYNSSRRGSFFKWEGLFQ